MSLSIVLCPLVIAMSISTSSSALGLLLNQTQRTASKLPVLTTRFADETLLTETLKTHGLDVQKTGEDEYTVRTPAGVLRYFRSSKTEPYRMETQKVKDLSALMDELETLNREYGCNVQSYTYHKVLDGLAEHGMRLESQTVLEDDSILLTISV